MSNDAENSALITEINYAFTFIHIEDIFSQISFLADFSHVLAGFFCQIGLISLPYLNYFIF